MTQPDHQFAANLLYACVDETQRGNEQFNPEHALGYIISGETHLQTDEGVQVFKAGTIGIVKRNQLIKSVKVPPPGGQFKAVNIFLTGAFLRRYCTENNIMPTTGYQGSGLLMLPPDPFLIGYFESLIPYFKYPEGLTNNLAELKTKEAVALILKTNPQLKELLFDFTEPYKIDLEAYMNQHFTYNVSLDHFARLTGRSIAGFKRDFQKIFNNSPRQWLQQKRLNEAYYLISQKGRKPSDVYMDVGFENFSHFSFAFKNTFGITPSAVNLL